MRVNDKISQLYFVILSVSQISGAIPMYESSFVFKVVIQIVWWMMNTPYRALSLESKGEPVKYGAGKTSKLLCNQNDGG